MSSGKDTAKRMERRASDSEKMLPRHLSGQGLASGTQEELSRLDDATQMSRSGRVENEGAGAALCGRRLQLRKTQTGPREAATTRTPEQLRILNGVSFQYLGRQSHSLLTIRLKEKGETADA